MFRLKRRQHVSLRSASVGLRGSDLGRSRLALCAPLRDHAENMQQTSACWPQILDLSQTLYYIIKFYAAGTPLYGQTWKSVGIRYGLGFRVNTLLLFSHSLA